MRTEASRLKPPVPCHLSMSSTVCSSRRPRRWKRRRIRRWRTGVKWDGVVAGEVGGLVEADAVVGTGEDAVEDHDVEVEVGVEGEEPKRWRKETAPIRASGPAPGLVFRRRVRTARTTTADGAGAGGIVVEEGANPLGEGEYPLADRERREDWIVQVGGDLDHAAGVAGRADAAALAGEGHQTLRGAVVAADAGEAVGQDPAAEVSPEVLLDPARYTLAPGVGLGGPGQGMSRRWCWTMG